MPFRQYIIENKTSILLFVSLKDRAKDKTTLRRTQQKSKKKKKKAHSSKNSSPSASYQASQIGHTSPPSRYVTTSLKIKRVIPDQDTTMYPSRETTTKLHEAYGSISCRTGKVTEGKLSLPGGYREAPLDER